MKMSDRSTIIVNDDGEWAVECPEVSDVQALLEGFQVEDSLVTSYTPPELY